MYNIRITGNTEESPESLLANPQNYKIHGMRQQSAIHKILYDVGFVQSVIVNDVTGHLIDGHLRVHMALSNNIKLIPVTHVELTEEEEATVLASFDPIGSLAKIDNVKFSELLDSMKSFDESIKTLITRDFDHIKQPNSPEILREEAKKYLLMLEFKSKQEYIQLKDELMGRGYAVRGIENER
jgi:hypothetical protein